MIIFPEISPYIFHFDVPKIGTLGPTWYGLMYVISFLLGLQWANRMLNWWPNWTKEQISDLLTYAIVGVILGGRVGYVLFYQFNVFLEDPMYLLRINQGGMSFHGGLLGVIAALMLFSYKYNKRWLDVCDFVAPIFPIGLFFGRIGNFINSELWGKTTDLPWGVVFPNGGDLPRHPSQLYESFLEGAVLFVLINLAAGKRQPRGILSGLFLAGYGIARFTVEFVRVPDAHIGYIAFGWLTKGQLLSLPMIAIGVALIYFGNKRGIDKY